MAPGDGLGVVVDGDVEIFAQSVGRPLSNLGLAGELKVAAERFGRIAEGKDLTESDELITRCRRRFVDRYRIWSEHDCEAEKEGGIVSYVRPDLATKSCR